jgi:hypothetical protein
MTGPATAFYETDLFVPHYAPMIQGDWRVQIAEMVLCRGYWSPPQLVASMPALIREEKSWMSMTPMELESQEIGVREAFGHVVIFGLGMGWSAVNSALRETVTTTTVVERDPDVIEMIAKLGIFAQLPEAAQRKIRVINGDAFDHTPDGPVDVLMPDIWLPLISDGRIEEVKRMQDKVKAKAVYFWGQELELARHAAARGLALDDAGIRAVIADWGLPLIGPDRPDYVEKLNAAARNCMSMRWLPGTVPPF